MMLLVCNMNDNLAGISQSVFQKLSEGGVVSQSVECWCCGRVIEGSIVVQAV